MKKNKIKQYNNKYLVAIFLLLTISIGFFIVREILIQKQIDRCYEEARERYEEALENVKELPPEKTYGNSYVSIWGKEDIETKMKLRDQLQKDEDRCLKRYK